MALLQFLRGLGSHEVRGHLRGVEAVEQRPVIGLPGAERHHPATIGAAADIVAKSPNLGIG